MAGGNQGASIWKKKEVEAVVGVGEAVELAQGR